MVVRFAVGGPGEPRSSVWRLWRHTNVAKSDVFLAPRTLAGSVKISFHQSGEIRDAFTKQFQLQHAGAGAQGRARVKWQRKTFSTETGAIQLYRVVFPHSELRLRPIEERMDEDSVVWIPPSAKANATFVELIVTRPGLTALEIHNFVPALDGPLAHWMLPNGENFIAIARVSQLEAETIAQIQGEIDKIPTEVASPFTPGVGLRLKLALDPLDGVGTTIETAWPSTLAAS